MKRNTQVYWIGVVVLLVVLLAGAGTQFRDTAALASEVTNVVAPVATTVTDANPEGAVAPAAIDEQEASNELEAQIVAIYEQASQSVVNITNRSYVYYRFMGAVPEEGTGSGFVYDTEGHIVTNYHVIEDAQELLVTLADGQVYEAEVVGSDPSNDLAVIQIDAGADLPAPLVLGDSDRLRTYP